VVQSDEFNASKIGTIVVVALTSNLALQAAPGNVALSRRSTGLPRRSIANVSQVLTVDKQFLTERIGKLPQAEFKEVEVGLRLVLAL
jgi:mRNA interferase MazF